MRKITVGMWALAALALASAAEAQALRRTAIHRGVPVIRAPVGATASAAAAARPPAASATAATPAPVPVVVDAGAAPAVADQETAAEGALRRAYVQRRAAAMRSIVHARHRKMTEEERAVIRQHWHRTMRLWRIRHLAAESGDKASVARVDTILSRADRKTDAQLTALASKAPAAGAGAK